ncbi:MAG TPA: RDD family protein [Actinomycetes bacterium]
MTRDIRYAEARALQGHRAGLASRVVADVIDLAVAWLLGLSALLVAGVVRYLLTGPPLRLPVMPRWLDVTGGAAIAVGYLAFSWAATGRSVGKQVAGLRVVQRVGRRLSLRRSLARAVLYVLFPAGLLWVLASRRNASVQDLVVGTAVVYDWAYHPADEALPTTGGRLSRPASSTQE